VIEKEALMRTSWVLAGCSMLACCSDNNKLGATPVGTILITWDATKPPDGLLDKAIIGKRTVTETSHVISVLDRDVTLKVRVETALLTYSFNKDISANAPITVTAIVQDSGDLALETEGCSNLSNTTFNGQQAPNQYMTMCRFAAGRETKHERAGRGAGFAVCGDGRVVAGNCN